MTGTSPPCLLIPRYTCRLCYRSVILCSVRTWKPTGTYRAVHTLQAGLHADAPSLWPFKLLRTLTGPFDLKFLLIFQGFYHLPGTPSKSRCRDPPSGIYQALLTSTSHYLSPHTLPAQKNLLVEIPELPRSLKWGKLKEEGNQCMFQKILLALLLWGVQRKTA